MPERHDTLALIEQRLDRLESRAQIGRLCSSYCHACDTSDAEGLALLFTEQGRVDIPAFNAQAEGRAAITSLYRAQFAGIPASNHWNHDLVIELSPQNPDMATGVCSAHAEIVLGDTVRIAALRYEDDYARIGGRWLINARKLKFMYFMPVADFSSRFNKSRRILLGDEWVRGDYGAGQDQPSDAA